jgi:hypothetical protein
MSKHPSHIYREYLRYGLRVLMSPEEEALLNGDKIGRLLMDDLEALFELVFLANPRLLAPPNYTTSRPAPR